MEKSEKSHAMQNADAYAESILEMFRGFKALEEGEEVVSIDGENFTNTDDLNDEVGRSALCVQFRSGWYSPGERSREEPEEFRILLTTGGPALQITGRIGERADMQYQDWFTPWVSYIPNVKTESDWEEALAWFVSLFVE